MTSDLVDPRLYQARRPPSPGVLPAAGRSTASRRAGRRRRGACARPSAARMVERNLRRVHGPGPRRAGAAARGRRGPSSPTPATGSSRSACRALGADDARRRHHASTAASTSSAARAARARADPGPAPPRRLGVGRRSGWRGCQQVPITVVVEPLEPPELFEWFVDLRRSLGMNVVPLGPGARHARWCGRSRRNHVVCLLGDRDLAGSGVEVEFFGERTTLPGGPGHPRPAHRRAAAARRRVLPTGRATTASCRPPLADRAPGPAARRRRPGHPGPGRTSSRS